MKKTFFIFFLIGVVHAEIHDVSILENDTASYNYADFRMWVNDSTDTLRGIYWFMHPNNGDSRNVVSDSNYQILASNQDFALLGAHIFNMHMYTGIGDAVIAAMDSFAVLFSHNEISFIPFFINGYSWGGQFGYHFTKWIPERMLGFITQKGGHHDTTDAGVAIEVPGLMFIAENDPPYRIENLTGIFLDHRPLGAKWILAMEQGVGHTQVIDYPFLDSFFNTVANLRLPDSMDVFQPISLNTLQDTIGWLGIQDAWVIGSWDCYDGIYDSSSWFPTREVGELWQNFVSEGSVTDTSQCGDLNGPWAWVNDGYLSGIYPPGDTVHIWSDLDPITMTFQGWNGDTSLLADSREWHTTFIMPDNNVHFYALQDSTGPIDFDHEVIQGAENQKNVYYKFPENSTGTIFFFHGGNGNAENIADRIEIIQFFQDALQEELGIIITESENTTLDVPGSNNRWLLQTWTLEENIDIANIQALIDTFTVRGNINAQDPIYSIGVSNGGNFSSIVAHTLNFNAAAMYSAQGNPPELYQVTETPTVFCPAKYDPALGGGNWAAHMNFDTLQARNIPSAFYELDRSPAYPQRFARIPGIDTTLSNDLFTEFLTMGFIDNDRYFTVLDDSIQSLYMTNPDTFSILSTLSIETVRHVLDQIKVMTADHSFFADYNERVLTFFNMYSDVLFIEMDTSIPHQFTLYPAYPNPFNPITTLRYDLPEQATVNIIIYDLLSRQVRTLVNQTQDAGYKSVIWNATNDYGKPVSAGVYLYKIQAGEYIQTKKMMLLK